MKKWCVQRSRGIYIYISSYIWGPLTHHGFLLGRDYHNIVQSSLRKIFHLEFLLLYVLYESWTRFNCIFVLISVGIITRGITSFSCNKKHTSLSTCTAIGSLIASYIPWSKVALIKPNFSQLKKEFEGFEAWSTTNSLNFLRTSTPSSPSIMAAHLANKTAWYSLVAYAS